MKSLFSGTLDIHYGQFYISLHEADVKAGFDLDSYFIDQNNGIVGSAQSNYMYFNAPPGVSVISIDVIFLDAPSTIEDQYDDVVEISCNKGAVDWYLSEWGWEKTHKLELPEGSYRMRLSISGFDLNHDENIVEGNEEYCEFPIPGQHYLLEFWPSVNAVDEILKQNSEAATNMHTTFPISRSDYEIKQKEILSSLNDDRPWWRFW